MKVSRKAKKQEAIKRMKALDIIDSAINQFASDDIVMISEPPMGGLYWADEEEKEMIKKFEEEHNALVYIVVRAFTNFGRMDSMLFVSDYDEEWEMDNDDIKDGYALTYTVNHDMPDCSEMGSIAVKSMFGGLVRVF